MQMGISAYEKGKKRIFKAGDQKGFFSSFYYTFRNMCQAKERYLPKEMKVMTFLECSTYALCMCVEWRYDAFFYTTRVAIRLSTSNKINNSGHKNTCENITFLGVYKWKATFWIGLCTRGEFLSQLVGFKKESGERADTIRNIASPPLRLKTWNFCLYGIFFPLQ